MLAGAATTHRLAVGRPSKRKKVVTYIIDTDGSSYCPAGIKESMWVSEGLISECRCLRCALAGGRGAPWGIQEGAAGPRGREYRKCQVSNARAVVKRKTGRGKDRREGQERTGKKAVEIVRHFP